jgi:hypothetical protein
MLLPSQVPANARRGLLEVLGLVNGCVASLLLLPLFLHGWPPGEEGRSEKAGSAGQQ